MRENFVAEKLGFCYLYCFDFEYMACKLNLLLRASTFTQLKLPRPKFIHSRFFQMLICPYHRYLAVLSILHVSTYFHTANAQPVTKNDDPTWNRTPKLPADQNATLSQRFPDAIIIGVKKCGTRALLEFLKINPLVKAPGPEVHFFDKNFDKGLDWYR
jgi:hypothetical protein